MACYHPPTVWRSLHVNKSGKRSLVWDKSKPHLPGSEQKIKCQQCIGCRLDKSRMWAVRCMHESSYYDHNCFVTLTYRDEDLPPYGTLVKKHVSDFVKRLKTNVRNLYRIQDITAEQASDMAKAIRVYYCGEYGSKLGRPHYHIIIFGFDFFDKLFLRNHNGYPIYTSALLERTWKFGYSVVQNFDFEVAAYVARYIVDKVNGYMADEHYRVVDVETGELIQLQPEFNDMSRRPGIGRRWIDEHMKETYRDDFIVIKGVKMPVPKYYDRVYEIVDPLALESVKKQRVKAAKKHASNNTDDRLIVRETVKKSELKSILSRLSKFS